MLKLIRDCKNVLTRHVPEILFMIMCFYRFQRQVLLGHTNYVLKAAMTGLWEEWHLSMRHTSPSPNDRWPFSFRLTNLCTCRGRQVCQHLPCRESVLYICSNGSKYAAWLQEIVFCATSDYKALVHLFLDGDLSVIVWWEPDILCILVINEN